MLLHWYTPGEMYRARLPALHCTQFPSQSFASIGRPRCAHTSACRALVQDIHDDVVSQKRSALEITREYLAAAHSKEGRLDSFLRIDDEGALSQAKAIDARIAAGDSVGPLAGVPVAVKDNICTAGLETTAGSRILEGYLPPYDATAVARLRAAGAVIMGKTNMDEFGMGSTTENSGYKATKNAWSAEHVPGGSSGGSAAAVSGGQVPVALGSDTGGSVRQPASFNGCVGVKPTYGRISRHGLIAYASSLDCVGTLTSTVYDAAAVLSVLAGGDTFDSTSILHPAEDFTAGLVSAEQFESRPLEGVRLAIIDDTVGEGVNGGVRDAIHDAASHFESLGASVGRVSMASFALGLPAYYIIASSEASSNLSRYDGVRYGQRVDADEMRAMYKRTRAQGLGAEVKRRIVMGTYALSAGYYDAFYKRAQQVRNLVKTDFDNALESYDALLCPAAPTAAYKFGEKINDPLSMYTGDLMTVNLNMAGLPSVCLNCGFVDDGPVKLPVGMQIIGQSLSEAQLLKIAHVFELTNESARARAPVATSS